MQKYVSEHGGRKRLGKKIRLGKTDSLQNLELFHIRPKANSAAHSNLPFFFWTELLLHRHPFHLSPYDSFLMSLGLVMQLALAHRMGAAMPRPWRCHRCMYNWVRSSPPERHPSTSPMLPSLSSWVSECMDKWIRILTVQELFQFSLFFLIHLCFIFFKQKLGCVFFSLLLVAPGILCSLFSFPKFYFEEFQKQKS